MQEPDVDDRFDRLEKQIEAVAKNIDVLARATEREFRDVHHSMKYQCERVGARLETIESRIEAPSFIS
jgi:hypothetical protein